MYRGDSDLSEPPAPTIISRQSHVLKQRLLVSEGQKEYVHVYILVELL